MRHIYAKNKFRKICARLQEDSSSIWFDHQEKELLEFEEVRKVYDKMKSNPVVRTVEQQQDRTLDKIRRGFDPSYREQFNKFYNSRKKDFDQVIENSTLQTSANANAGIAH